jgi:hypothetical protein
MATPHGQKLLFLGVGMHRFTQAVDRLQALSPELDQSEGSGFAAALLEPGTKRVVS